MRVTVYPRKCPATSKLVKCLTENLFKNEHAKFVQSFDTDIKFLKRYLERNNVRSRKLFEYCISRMLEHKRPLSYLIKKHDFVSSSLYVEEPVLLPRSETEEWVNKLIGEIKLFRRSDRQLRIIDFCSGSGCIGLEIAKSVENVIVYGAEKYKRHLNIATRNSLRNNVALNSKGSSFVPVKMDVLKSCLFLDQQADIIVSNPPYIPNFRQKHVQESVSRWEHDKALFPGKISDTSDNGLDFHEKIFIDSKYLLKRTSDYVGPRIVTEFDGIYQARRLAAFAENCGLKDYKFVHDFNGQTRSFWVY